VLPLGFCQARHRWYSHRRLSSPLTVVYDPKAFIPHAASLGQAFAHCRRFSTAASRRSLGSVSVPVWPATLSGRLPIVALVGRYPTNKLIGHRPLHEWQVPASRNPHLSIPIQESGFVSGIATPLGELSRSRGQVIYALLTLSPLGSPRVLPLEMSSLDLHA
jgi:hypothetical protein